MNPLDQLGAARPAYLDTATDPETRARELHHALSGPRQTRSGRLAGPRRVRLPILGTGLVAATAAAATAIVVVSHTAPDRPGHSHPGTASAPSVRLDARQVLLAAAAGAARQPDTSGAWWHTRTVSQLLVRVASPAPFWAWQRQGEQMWTSRDPAGDQWSSTRSLAFRPAGAADAAAWKRAGSPAQVTTEAVTPGAKGSVGKLAGETLSATDGPAHETKVPSVGGGDVFWLGRNVTMRELLSLPDTPRALKSWLLASYGGHDTESDSTPESSQGWLFRVATGLISDMPVRPKVRAAAFAMLADLPGVSVTRGVRTADGGIGTAVGIEEVSKAKATDPTGGLNLDRLVFDESTGRPLQTDSIVVKPGGLQSGLAPGTVWTITTIGQIGWTDARP
jgi:hypothetical protein